MGDIDLTAEQWRMARQAGAAFTSEDEAEQLPLLGTQLSLPGLGPDPGELFRNVHTGEIGTVITAATRRKSWVTIRRGGRLTDVPLHWLEKHWAPCRPDGTPR